MTEIFRLFLVLGDNRRKPYSKAYSTMYRSSGHTIQQTNEQKCPALHNTRLFPEN